MDSLQYTPDREARSPWSTNTDKKWVEICPPIAPVEGTIRLSGSKSLTNRALIIAALAEGTSHIDGVLRSDDTYWCIDCLTKVGIRVDIEGDNAQVEGCGGFWPNNSGELYVGAAGTVVHAFLASSSSGRHWCMDDQRK